MGLLYDEWLKSMQKLLEEHPEKRQFPNLCPKCRKQTLSFDEKTGRLYCTNCGFEARIKITKR